MLQLAGVFAEARPAGPVALTDTVGSRSSQACRLGGDWMTWHRTRSCHEASTRATGNNNPSTSYSAISRNFKVIYGHAINCWAGCFKLKHFGEFISGHFFTCKSVTRREDRDVITFCSETEIDEYQVRIYQILSWRILCC